MVLTTYINLDLDGFNMGEKASVKVPDGKLVQVEAEFGEVLSDVSITGDFFVEPPQALEDIEKAIIGLPADFEKRQVIEAIEQVEAELIGFSPEDIVEALRQVVSG